MKTRHIIISMLAAMAAMAFQACSSDDEPDGGISVIKDSQTPENALDRG